MRMWYGHLQPQESHSFSLVLRASVLLATSVVHPQGMMKLWKALQLYAVRQVFWSPDLSGGWFSFFGLPTSIPIS